ncbi:MAG TPA: carboxypeptidase-like regulatory domain-containing protein, partial [Chitinophagales bacterium]|nr:carboxypeptidase-like regulatory domain-containing protein [Chitinophagales bacterium]
MQKSFYLILFSLFLQFSLFSQNNTVTGYLVDHLNSLPVVNASISIVNAKDSLLQGFSRTDHNGFYSISGIDTGNMTIYYSYPGFLINSEDFSVTGKNAQLKRDTASLYKQDLLLNEVTIIDQSTIKIKGDTIEFKADSFAVSKNANAEDLLKKLPGVQVNSKGEITAMGERVQKVYVDGEEFFGEDPTIATKNIQAKAIDKVQVYDQKSEQATLTGLDDGQKM